MLQVMISARCSCTAVPFLSVQSAPHFRASSCQVGYRAKPDYCFIRPLLRSIVRLKISIRQTAGVKPHIVVGSTRTPAVRSVRQGSRENLGARRCLDSRSAYLFAFSVSRQPEEPDLFTQLCDVLQMAVFPRLLRITSKVPSL